MKYSLIVLSLCCGLLKAEPSKLLFSNTQNWGSNFAKVRDSEPKILKKSDFSSFQLPAPPANTSKETEREIAYLSLLETERTSSQKLSITLEAVPLAQSFLGHSLADLLNSKKHPATAELLKVTLNDANIAIMKMKAKFDRVRPSLLDKELQPCISVPEHPSYPSGHAGSSYLLELVLGHLWPHKKAELALECDTIAKNREIAGVHYPSDTEAGKLLAYQIFGKLSTNLKWYSMLERARKEWNQ